MRVTYAYGWLLLQKLALNSTKAHLPCTLSVYIHDTTLPFANDLIDRQSSCAIEVLVHLGEFHKLPFSNHRYHLVHIYEMVVLPFYFVRTRAASCKIQTMY